MTDRGKDFGGGAEGNRVARIGLADVGGDGLGVGVMAGGEQRPALDDLAGDGRAAPLPSLDDL